MQSTRAWLVVAFGITYSFGVMFDGLSALATVIRALAAEWRSRRAIRELELLDDHRLRDLGLTRRNIERVVRRGRGPDADVPPATRSRDHDADGPFSAACSAARHRQ